MNHNCVSEDEDEDLVETSEDEEDAAIEQIWSDLLAEEAALKERSRCRHVFEPSDFVVASFLSATNSLKTNPQHDAQKQCVGTILSFLHQGWSMQAQQPGWCMRTTGGLLQDHTAPALLDVAHAMEANEAVAEACRHRFEEVCEVLCSVVLVHAEGEATACQCPQCLETIMRSVANSSAREILGIAICSTLLTNLKGLVNPGGEVTLSGPYANAVALLEPLKDITRAEREKKAVPSSLRCEIRGHFEQLQGAMRRLPQIGTGQPHLAALRMYLWHIAATAQ